jgi:glycosyltransferase involved in cell wall biosynthesis
VIASAVGAISELVQADPRGRTGWLVPPDDPVALARAIAEALAVDPHSYRSMAVQARKRAEYLFSPVRIAAATLGVYAGLLEGRG